MNKKAAPSHITIGKLGEESVRRHLKRKGFIFIESNFRAKTGEIDLIMLMESKIHFIEVKSVSCVTPHNVSRETYKNEHKIVSHGTKRSNMSRNVTHETYRPEEKVDAFKLKKLMRTIGVWIAKNKYEGEWQFDIAAVFLDPVNRAGRIRMLENIVAE